MILHNLLIPHRNVRKTVQRILTEKEISVYNATEISSIDSTEGSQQYLVSKDGSKYPFDEAFWCTQASAQSWLKETGLALDDEGFIMVQV